MTLPHGVSIEYVVLYGVGIGTTVVFLLMLGAIKADHATSYSKDPSVRDIVRETLAVLGLGIGLILVTLVFGYIAAFTEQVVLA